MVVVIVVVVGAVAGTPQTAGHEQVPVAKAGGLEQHPRNWPRLARRDGSDVRCCESAEGAELIAVSPG